MTPETDLTFEQRYQAGSELAEQNGTDDPLVAYEQASLFDDLSTGDPRWFEQRDADTIAALREATVEVTKRAEAVGWTNGKDPAGAAGAIVWVAALGAGIELSHNEIANVLDRERTTIGAKTRDLRDTFLDLDEGVGE